MSQSTKRIKYQIPEGGFSLVESLVAISVLLVVVVAPISIVGQELIAARVSRENLIATYLAQEGVEVIRAVRDTNRLRDGGWLSGLDVCVEPKKCYVGARKISVLECTGGLCPQLRFDEDDTGFYGYQSGDPNDPFSEFRREMQIEKMLADEIVVYSRVFWEGLVGERSITIEDHLYNWQ